MDGCAHLIVTNPIAKMTLNKKDIQDSICSALTQISGQTIQSLEIIIMTKEEYFAHQMSQ